MLLRPELTDDSAVETDDTSVEIAAESCDTWLEIEVESEPSWLDCEVDRLLMPLATAEKALE